MGRKRGRPAKSQIRSNILELLALVGEVHGYQLTKLYNEVFPKVTMRSIYYHLHKGCDLKEIALNRVVEEKGDFSWGTESKKVKYILGEEATVKGQLSKEQIRHVEKLLDEHHNRTVSEKPRAE